MKKSHFSWSPRKDGKRKGKGENGTGGSRSGVRKEGPVQKEGREIEGRQEACFLKKLLDHCLP